LCGLIITVLPLSRFMRPLVAAETLFLSLALADLDIAHRVGEHISWLY
jgi:hypothetical protein